MYVSHVTQMNANIFRRRCCGVIASCHTHEYVMLQFEMSHVTHMDGYMSHTWNESCHTHIYGFHVAHHRWCECSMSHTWMLHVIWNESCWTYAQVHEWVMSHTWNESCHTHTWRSCGTPQMVWMHHVTCMNVSRHTCEMRESYPTHTYLECGTQYFNPLSMHSYVWHDSFTHVTWFFRICNMNYTYQNRAWGTPAGTSRQEKMSHVK